MSGFVRISRHKGSWPALLLLLFPLLPRVSDAALEKFELRRSNLRITSNSSPTIDFTPVLDPDGEASVGFALIDESGSPPALRFETVADGTQTVEVQALSGFIWVSRKFSEGPLGVHTGVSGTSGGQIAWGTVTGWGYSGTHWCNSEPASLCFPAGDIDESTNSSPGAPSPFYDIGTWYFHGTGFTSQGFVWSRFTVNAAPGTNFQYILRGAFAPDGTVPALPLTGAVLLGLSVLAAGGAALRRR